jgi:uncharacterized protein (TIGR03435 family)
MGRYIRWGDGRFLFLIATTLGIFAWGGPFQLQLRAQSQATPLAFEVVSVKVNKPGQSRDLAIQYLPGGRFSARAVPIPLLLLEAYDTPRLYPSAEFRKLDVSAIERDVYDIEATAPKDAIPSGSSSKVRNDKIREMLRTLLAERFKLRVHHETQEDVVNALVVAKNGPKFQTGIIEECADRPTNFFDPGSCHSMADLLRFASRVARLERPLIDKTGLNGLYNIPSIDWSALISGTLRSAPGVDPTQAFNDLLDKIGLRLDTQKATLDMLLVDHVETPSLEN